MVVWLILAGLVLTGIHYPLIDLAGPILVLVIVLPGVLIMLGDKSAGGFLGAACFYLLILLIIPPLLYQGLAQMVAYFRQALPKAAGFPLPYSLLGLILGLVLVLGLVVFVVRTHLMRINRAKRLSLEESLRRRAIFKERRRVIPETLGRHDQRGPPGLRGTDHQNPDDNDPLAWFEEKKD